MNDRFIKSPYLNHAVTAAFEGLLKEKTYPSYFLYLNIDPKRIDINIHPTKTEIKFDDEHALYAILRSAIKHSLGQFNVAPVLDFERDANLDTPYSYKEKQAEHPIVEVDRNFNPFESEMKFSSSSSTSVKTSSSKSNFQPSFSKKNEGSWEALYTEFDSSKPEADFSNVEFESEEVTGSLFEDEKKSESGNTFQLQKKYIISSLKSGLLVIDQHRAHTRILYEDLLKSITVKAAISQQLLFPLILQYSKQETAMLRELKDSLEQTGFVFARIENHEVEIKGIPNLISESEVSILLDQLLSDFENEIPESGFKQTDLLAKSLAKSMAIKTGAVLDTVEQIAIVNGLFACKEPDVTPSNRKVFVTLAVDELEKKFM